MSTRIIVALLVVAIMSIFSTAFVRAEDAKDAKEITLKGTLACAKCTLHEGATCQNVLMTKDGDKTQRYYLADNELSKSSHAAVCHGAKENVSVTGTVSEKDGKQWITASKIEGLPEKSDEAKQ